MLYDLVSFQAHAPQHAFCPELSRLDLSHLYYHSRTSKPESEVALGGTGTASAADSVGSPTRVTSSAEGEPVKIGTSYGGSALG